MSGHYRTTTEEVDERQYVLRAYIEPPTFRRHGRRNGDRYGEPVAVGFEDVEVETGQGRDAAPGPPDSLDDRDGRSPTYTTGAAWRSPSISPAVRRPIVR